MTVPCDENINLQLEMESKQFADEAYAAAVTQQDKDKEKAAVKKSDKGIKQIKDAITAAEEEKSAAMATIFSTTGNFFRGDGKTPWDKIVLKQTERDPWIDLRGVEHTGVRGKSMQAWKDCFMLMLKTFQSLCDSFGLKCKPTSIKNPQANAILERIHQTLVNMMRTAELDMADSVSPNDIADFLNDAAWAVRSTYYTVLKASPGAAIFGRDMLFDVPFLADWKKIGDYRQRQTDCNTERENKTRVDWDYKVGDKVLL
eukprot:scaffold154747_cov38-Cyclotella_meneghiniana.AAC.3